MISIMEQTETNDEIISAIEKLLPQLSPTATLPSREQISEIIESENIKLYCATDGDDHVVGMLVLVIFRIPTGLRFRIEDVVVDEAARGLGVGKELLLHALADARELGADKVDLSCRPAREAANRLYQKLGFEKRNTNVYRFHIKS